MELTGRIWPTGRTLPTPVLKRWGIPPDSHSPGTHLWCQSNHRSNAGVLLPSVGRATVHVQPSRPHYHNVDTFFHYRTSYWFIYIMALLLMILTGYYELCCSTMTDLQKSDPPGVFAFFWQFLKIRICGLILFFHWALQFSLSTSFRITTSESHIHVPRTVTVDIHFSLRIYH